MTEKIFPYTSLCQVIDIDSRGKVTLKRLADVENGILLPQFSYESPTYKTLYTKNYNLATNSIVIFNWRTEPNFKNAEKDYIRAEIDYEKQPIEILILKSCVNKNDLRNKLLSGIKFDFSTDRILILYLVRNRVLGATTSYRGVLCTEDDFKQDGDKKKITAVNLQYFEVTEQNLIQIDEKIFYAKLDLEEPIKIFHTKSLTDIIKDKIISRVSWTTFRDRVSESDMQIFCDYLKNFSAEDFYTEIANEYVITSEEAKKYVDMFVQRYQQYLQTEIFNDEVFEK